MRWRCSKLKLKLKYKVVEVKLAKLVDELKDLMEDLVKVEMEGLEDEDKVEVIDEVEVDDVESEDAVEVKD